jgi:putative transposase
MTKKPEPKKDAFGNFVRNGTRAKAGLNRAILSSCWGLFVLFLSYKARRNGKLVIKVPPQFSSQECAQCGHIHPDNRHGIGKEKQLGQEVCVKASGEDDKTRRLKRLRALSTTEGFSVVRSETQPTAKSAWVRESSYAGVRTEHIDLRKDFPYHQGIVSG